MMLAITQWGVALAMVAASPAEADRVACERLSNDYAAAVDGNDPAALANLFTPDGRWQLSDKPMIGRDAIRAYLTDFVARKTVTSMHVTSNVRITLTGPDTAIGTAYVMIYGIAKGEKPGVPRGLGVYRDRFVRTAQGWRFAERVLDRVTA